MSLTGTELYDKIVSAVRSGCEFIDKRCGYIHWVCIAENIFTPEIIATMNEYNGILSLIRVLGGRIDELERMDTIIFADSEIFLHWVHYRRYRNTNFSPHVVHMVNRYSKKFNYNPRSIMRDITMDDDGSYLRGITEFLLNHPHFRRFDDIGRIRGDINGRHFIIRGWSVRDCLESGLISERTLQCPFA